MSKKTPQIRFKGFTGDWEERKLGDVISISSEKNGNQFSRADVLSVSREAGVVNQIEYQGRSFAGASIANYRVVHKGDLIYTKSPLKGAPNGIFKTSEAEGIVSPLYAVYQSREANAAFVGWLLSNDNFATHYLYPLVNKGSKNTLLVSDADAISGHLSFPNIEEQAKIVSFFTQLDNLIALHQRKLDLLKEQKKGFLQKMFPKNGARVPELRFEGFTDDWEERKLSDIVSRLSKSSNNSGLPKVEFEDIVSGEGRLNKDVSHKFDDRKGILFSSQNILYGKLRPYLKNWLLADFKGIALGDFWVLKSTNSDPKFVYSLIQSNHYQKVANDTSGTKMPRSDWKKVSSTDFQIPTSLEEQKKIGSFFKQLDNTIALHQRKLDLLKQQKKGFLQKMFVS
ncbi:restriction endonuclease subunit S [Leuconostoc mesenteroides]|uniref:restriction endonuclease subunit S n=1 Tax=Leuconostoc mesenteroides TaxID=1245 RepID=UPI0021BFB62B|nr:restriction endonuclease subunit S [Leuconostoc mesenteroides]MCT8385926.1 restriction endonuclease subunit S [Leuconostoc mesenteroides]